jgi:hypothetical protein
MIPLLLRIGIPARLHKAALIGAAVVALLAAFFIWLAVHDRGVVEADRSASNAKAVTTAREADERAETAATGQSDRIEKGNRDAEEAARNSDDPLADGLRSLRESPRPDR